MLNLGVAELAKSFGGYNESTRNYHVKSPKAYAASATHEPNSSVNLSESLAQLHLPQLRWFIRLKRP